MGYCLVKNCLFLTQSKLVFQSGWHALTIGKGVRMVNQRNFHALLDGQGRATRVSKIYPVRPSRSHLLLSLSRLSNTRREIHPRRSFGTFDGFRSRTLSLLNERDKRIAAEADLIEVTKNLRVVDHEHWSQLSGRRCVAEAAEYLAAAVASRVEQSAASFRLVAEHPKVAVIVDDVRPFVFDVELSRPDLLILQLEIVRDEVLEEEFAPFSFAFHRQVTIGDAAKHDRSLCVDLDAAVDVRKMFERHDRCRAIDDAEVGLRLAEVVDAAARSDKSSDLTSNQNGRLHGI